MEEDRPGIGSTIFKIPFSSFAFNSPDVLGLNQVQIMVNPFIQSRTERKQVRFPTSKKKRIRNKWKKDSNNFKTKEVEDTIKMGNKLYVSQKTYDRLLQEIKDI